MEKMSDSVVRHVDGRVRKRLNEELRVPRNPRTKTVASRARPLLEPSEDTLESISGLGEVGVHSSKEPEGDHKGKSKKESKRFLASRTGMAERAIERETAYSRLSGLPPLLFSVVNVPLVDERDDTLLSTPAHDEALRLGVLEGQSLTDEKVSNLGLGRLDRLAIKLSVAHRSVEEALLVGDILGLEEKLGVLLRLDLELLAERRCDEVTVSGRRDDGQDLELDPLGGDLVEFGLLLEVHVGCVIVGRVGRDRGNDTGTLWIEEREPRDI